MILLRKYHFQIDQVISSRSPGAFRIAFGALLFLLAGLGLLFLVMGAPAMNGFAGDVPVLLDGGWRIYNGQVPHRDFYNFLGDLPFYVVWLGMKVGKPSVSAIDYGNVLMMVPISLATAILLYRRTTALCTFLFSLFLALIIITPRPLGAPFDYTDHSEMYNRYGEAFIMLLGIILFLPRKSGESGCLRAGAEMVFAGFLLVAALGCKLNYLAVSVGFLIVAGILQRITLAQASICILSAIAFLSIALVVTKIPLSALVQDYRIMAGVQSFASKVRVVAVQGVKSVVLLPILLLLVWESFLGETKGVTRELVWRNIIIVFFIFGGAVLLLATNSQRGELPLLALAALFGFELVLNQHSSAETAVFQSARHCGALLLVLIFLLPSIITSFKTIRFAAYAALGHRTVSTPALEGSRLSDFRFIWEGDRKAEMRDVREDFDDGIGLLRRNLSASTPVNIILFANPFQVALGWVPPPGGTTCVADQGFARQSHPSLARLLGNSHYLMTDAFAIRILKTAYGSEWDDLHLPAVEETKYYTLFAVPGGTAALLEETRSHAKPN
jgi:hypothetical protein